MLRNLDLDKPLAFIDIETTGLRPNSGRIVELSVLKIHPDGKREYKSHRINPAIPIPVETTAIYGITTGGRSTGKSQEKNLSYMFLTVERQHRI